MARRHNLPRAALGPSLLLAATCALSCSGSSPRDINFGTDAGAGFVPPDAGADVDTSVTAPDATDADQTTSTDADQDTSGP